LTSQVKTGAAFHTSTKLSGARLRGMSLLSKTCARGLSEALTSQRNG